MDTENVIDLGLANAVGGDVWKVQVQDQRGRVSGHYIEMPVGATSGDARAATLRRHGGVNTRGCWLTQPSWRTAATGKGLAPAALRSTVLDGDHSVRPPGAVAFFRVREGDPLFWLYPR